MFTELIPSQYAAILPLYAPLDFNLVIRSVVEGNTPAWVYADDPSGPHTALIWDRQDAILIAGNASEGTARSAMRQVIMDQIVPNARSRGIPEFALLSTPAWEPLIPGLFSALSPQSAARYSYRLASPRLDPPPPVGLPPLPKGTMLQRIDDGLLSSQLVHLEDVRGWIDSFWRTPQDFLHTGYGYCAVSGDAIASWCLTVFAASSARELGLATVPDYRQRGLATLVAAACIEHGMAHEQQLHWHCWADNRPSALIAQKTGFRMEREYSVYRLKI
jgi:RimJ/RimL family protein N-acetyltransferase